MRDLQEINDPPKFDSTPRICMNVGQTICSQHDPKNNTSSAFSDHIATHERDAYGAISIGMICDNDNPIHELRDHFSTVSSYLPSFEEDQGMDEWGYFSEFSQEDDQEQALRNYLSIQFVEEQRNSPRPMPHGLETILEARESDLSLHE